MLKVIKEKHEKGSDLVFPFSDYQTRGESFDYAGFTP
jgi:hypothetical protein